MAEAPRSTIVPTAAVHSTAGARALAMLADLSSRPSGKQLVPGEVIGQGGMGVVRAAEQVALGRSVAVKTLRADRRGPGPALDLLREAWVTGSLEHPNIVPVHYLELDDEGTPTIVLKRISGVEWSTVIDDPHAVAQRFAATDLLAWNLGILLAILDAVRFAHARGIVHRDLKPSNVMVGDFGEVYLLDWGIAVALEDDGSGRLPLAKHASEMAGTPCYMAPEMLGGEGRAPIDARTDVYLAGAVLFEVITGRPPHEGPNAIAMIASILHGAPRLPATVPGELAAICLRALAPAPADRFQTIEDLRAAIRGYLSHRGSTALSDTATARLLELRGVLAQPRPVLAADRADDPVALDEHAAAEAVRGDAVYKLFGGCRFGYLEALAVWPDNASARAGLDAAIVAVAEDELAGGNPRAALALVADLADPVAHDALAAKARVELERAKRHHAALEELQSAHDPKAGRRTRFLLTGILGVVFTVFPIIAQVAPVDIGFSSARGIVRWAAASLAILLVAVTWARDTMLRGTLINRRIALTGVYLFASQIVLAAGADIAGFTIVQTHLAMVFLWAALTWMLAITVDGWLAPAGVAYLAAFVLAARFPEQRLAIIAVANGAFAINTAIRWRPASIRRSAEERAAQARISRRGRAGRARDPRAPRS